MGLPARLRLAGGDGEKGQGLSRCDPCPDRGRIEGIRETGDAQAKNFARLEAELAKRYPNLWAMGTGACTKCKKCTYPDAPCRFPDQLFSSMEACGLYVSKVCTDNGLPYNYGPNKLAYSACFLLE